MLVATTTLSKALDDNGIKQIDFMSMDIEGSEIPALKGFDIERFQPKLTCIETKVKNRDGILAYFSAHGYRRLEEYIKYDQTNWYFAPVASR